jgi:copper transport protein
VRCSAVVAAIVGLVFQTGLAFAHASLVRSDPADGAVLAAAPTRLVLTFNEPVSPLVLSLIDDKGRATTLSRYRLEDDALIIEAPAEIMPGAHALSWRVVSADGHPVGGSVVFSVGAPGAGGVPGAAEVVDWPLRAAIWLSRVAIYLGFFVGVGGLVFAAFVAKVPHPAVRVQQALLLVALVATPLSVGLQGLDALGLPLFDLAQPIVWRTAMGTSYGMTAIIAFLALVAALAGPLVRSPTAMRVLSVAAFLGVGFALAASGHASAAAPQIVTRPAVFLHATAVAFWIGALLPLGFALRENRSQAAAALARFSKAIPFVIVPLIAAGIVLALMQVERPTAIWTTAYGWVLLVKLALLAVLFALAAINRWRLTAPVEAGDPAAARSLASTIAVETVVAVAILGVVATWRFTPPPRALEAAAARPASVHIHTAKAMADVTITPGHAGPVSASIVIMTGDFGPLDAKEVTLVLSNLPAGIEPMRWAATKPGDGTWRADGLVIPAPGRWGVQIAIVISDFELIRLQGTVDIR